MSPDTVSSAEATLNFNSQLSKVLYLGLSLVIMLLVGNQVSSAQAPLLISITFKTNNPFGNSPPMSGPEAAATLANPSFGAANVWNNLHVEWAPPLTTNRRGITWSIALGRRPA